MRSVQIFNDNTLYDRIYHFLWQKNICTENQLNLNLPNTVLFKNSIPIYWYFSTKEG
jgi:hypothetical protein